MMVGKRTAVMRRTTSMSGGMAVPVVEEQQQQLNIDQTPITTNPNNLTTNPSSHHHTSHFLRTCGLCNAPLAPARDIYMYRGDTAFCSLECREKQMKQDQKKEKYKLATSDKEHRRNSPPTTAAARPSTQTETTACI